MYVCTGTGRDRQHKVMDTFYHEYIAANEATHEIDGMQKETLQELVRHKTMWQYTVVNCVKLGPLNIVTGRDTSH